MNVNGAETPRVGYRDCLRRRDFTVASDPGIDLFVREIVPRHSAGTAILLVHGARVPCLGSYDLPVPGGSLGGELALAGHPTFMLDVRGYGRSTRPQEMDQPPGSGGPSLVRAPEAARDIDRVVDEIKSRISAGRVAVFGWASGGQWVGYYAALHREKPSHVILHNTLYGARAPHPVAGHGSPLEDPACSGRFNSWGVGRYRFSTREELQERWDRAIPVPDRSQWRNDDVYTAYLEAAMASDPASADRSPQSFRAPSGAMEDGFLAATGRQLWDASLITAPTLVIRSGRDFWSRQDDVHLLLDHLVHARRVRAVVIPQATHHVHLDHDHRGRRDLINEICEFLTRE